MVITIYGEDTFRSREFLHSTIDQFKKKRDPSGLNIHRIDATRTPLTEVAHLEGMGGLFGSGKRLFIVERLEEIKQDLDALKAFLESRGSSEGNVVCFYMRGNVTGVVGKAMTSVQFVYPFKTLVGRELEDWIRNRSTVYGSELPLVLVRAMMIRFGGDLWAIDRELASLSGLARGGAITERLYRTREVDSMEHSSFELIESLLAGRWKKALAVTPRMGTQEWIPFVMLYASHVRGILWLKERSKRGTSGGTLPLNPYFMKKLSVFEPRLTIPELVSTVESLVDLDVRMKTTPVAPDALALLGLLK